MYGNLNEDQRRQLNELLSQTTISSIGGQGYIDGEQNGRLSDLMNPQQQPRQQMPQNFVQRGSNAPIDMDQRQPAPQNFFQRGNNDPVDMGQSRRSHDVYRDGPEILNSRLLPDGRTVNTVRVPSRDGFGRQTTDVREEVITPEHLNPANIARMKFEEAEQRLAGGIGGQDWMKDFDGSGKLLLVNRRTGEIKRPSEDITGAQYSPELAGRISGAKTAGDANAKRDINMGGLNNAIQEAEDLLTGASGKPLPTGSTFGTAVDATAGFFGGNPDGAAEAQTLKALSGALTAKMPRMEGPQSDKDVQMYREMSAVVGDSTVPRERRIAALKQVKSLWGKYDKSGGAAVPVKNEADAMRLPLGTKFTLPNGRVGVRE